MRERSLGDLGFCITEGTEDSSFRGLRDSRGGTPLSYPSPESLVEAAPRPDHDHQDNSRFPINLVHDPV
jgi:hypothetical protein